MKNQLVAKLLTIAVISIVSCNGDDPKEPDTCSDGLLNGTETSVDCGGKCEACEPQPTKAYYIKFKVNEVWKIYETSDAGFQVCGNCGCSAIPPLDDSNNSVVAICQTDGDYIEAADIVGWNGKTISFKGAIPFAKFGYTEGGVDFSTLNVLSQGGSSSMIISNVEPDGDISGNKAYKVSGTFNCKVAKSGSASISITEGEFVVKFTEDF